MTSGCKNRSANASVIEMALWLRLSRVYNVKSGIDGVRMEEQRDARRRESGEAPAEMVSS